MVYPVLSQGGKSDITLDSFVATVIIHIHIENSMIISNINPLILSLTKKTKQKNMGKIIERWTGNSSCTRQQISNNLTNFITQSLDK